MKVGKEMAYPEAKMIEAMRIWKLPENSNKTINEIYQSGEYFAQQKIDGFWYEFEKTPNYEYLFSRNTSQTTGMLSEKSANVPHIMKALSCLPANTIIIGEIFYPGGTSKTVTTVMGCLPKTAIERQRDNPIHYYLHDIIEYDGVNLISVPATLRYDILKKVWELHNLSQYNFLMLADKIEENIEQYTSSILNSGGEGIVLKKKNLPYYPGKKPAWSTIKVKKMDTIDLICTGLCDPTKEYTGKELNDWEYNISHTTGERLKGKYKDLVKAGFNPIAVTKPYYCGWKTAIKIGAYDDEGKLVTLGTVSSGLTDEDRRLMGTNPEDYIGKVYSLTCMEKNNVDHTLRHPVLVAKRIDKPATDCKISEIFS